MSGKPEDGPSATVPQGTYEGDAQQMASTTNNWLHLSSILIISVNATISYNSEMPGYGFTTVHVALGMVSF